MKNLTKKIRQYNVEYLRYGFIASPIDNTKPMCLLCNASLSNGSMKPSKLQNHLEKIHEEHKAKDILFFQELQRKHTKQLKLEHFFATGTKKVDDGLRASYNISLLIAKSGKPHSIGEDLILPAIGEAIHTMMHISPESILKKISLSNNTVQRRIDTMANDVESTLCGYLKTSYFSLQLDESTLPGNEVLLMGYVRFIKDESVCQEMLFARSLETDTRGESLFTVLKDFLDEKEIPLTNLLTIATDGAPAMIGRHKGLIAHVKKILPNILTIHCVIHRQHLVARNLSERLHISLGYVIQAINRIKSNSLNSRLFNQFCLENDEDYIRLLLHTEVRWLSKGVCLNRFYSLYDSVLAFLHNKDNELRNKLLEIKNDVAYMADLFAKFNEMNLKLQGDDLNLIKTKSILCGFVSKLALFRQNIGRSEFGQFKNLATVSPTDEDILAYVQHLGTLSTDFNQRFGDVFQLVIPDWVLDPFSSMSIDCQVVMQEELIELQLDEELKFKFKEGYQAFWLQSKIKTSYTKLWSVVEKLLLPFPSSYLVERGFSAVTDLLTKKRNRLQIADRGDLRLYLTKIKPDLEKLIESHQIHPSH